MTPSVTIRDDSCTEWLRKSSEFEWMVNLLLMWLSPDMHGQAAKSLQASKLNQENLQPGYLPNVMSWPSVFSALSVISNRRTKSHLDKGSYDSAYDIVLSGGDYSNCRFEVEDIGAQFRYEPGTLVALLGRALRHKVPRWMGKDRTCYAHYVRDDVLLKHECRRSGWVDILGFKKYMGERFREGLQGTCVKAAAI